MGYIFDRNVRYGHVFVVSFFKRVSSRLKGKWYFHAPKSQTDRVLCEVSYGLRVPRSPAGLAGQFAQATGESVPVSVTRGRGRTR